ncbi:hypothetical protein PPYR_01500, partial [Photinus pyralis]
KQVEAYLTRFNKITISQHGFRYGSSTESSTIEYVQFVNERLDSGDHVVSILFGLTRAFDMVHKSFVSDKLNSLGIRGCINKWVVSYLDCRKIMVRVNDVYSKEFNIDLGTPQGS